MSIRGLLVLGVLAVFHASCAPAQRTAKQPSQSEERALALRTARSELARCSGNEACAKQAAIVWRLSDDAAEIGRALAIVQAACDVAVYDPCRVARAASWYGRGVPVNVAASVAFHRKCSVCRPFDPAEDTIDHDGFASEPWAALTREQLLERARTLAAMGQHDLVIQLAAEARKAGTLAEDAALALAETSITALWDAHIQPRIAKGALFDAFSLAKDLVADAELPSTVARRDRLEADLAARELALVTQARAAKLPFAEYFHARHAAMFSATVVLPPEPRVEAPRSAGAKGISIAGVPESCRLIRATLVAHFERAKDVIEFDASGVSCAISDEDAKTVEERYQAGEESYETTETVDDGEECTSTSDTVCTSTDGNCYTRTTCTPKTKKVKVTRTRPVYKTRDKIVRSLTLEVKGQLKSALGTTSIHYRGVGEETKVVRDAVADIASSIDNTFWNANNQVKLELMDREDRLASSSTGLEREEHLLRVRALGRPNPAQQEVLGLSEAELTALLRDGRYSRNVPRPWPL